MSEFPDDIRYAVIDPKWGEPCVIPETIAEAAEAAREKALMHPQHALWSGASLSCVPPRPGKWENLERQGYRLARVCLQVMEVLA